MIGGDRVQYLGFQYSRGSWQHGKVPSISATPHPANALASLLRSSRLNSFPSLAFVTCFSTCTPTLLHSNTLPRVPNETTQKILSSLPPPKNVLYIPRNYHSKKQKPPPPRYPLDLIVIYEYNKFIAQIQTNSLANVTNWGQSQFLRIFNNCTVNLKLIFKKTV